MKSGKSTRCLPASKEVLLEVEVNKLIDKVLFSKEVESATTLTPAQECSHPAGFNRGGKPQDHKSCSREEDTQCCRMFGVGHSDVKGFEERGPPKQQEKIASIVPESQLWRTNFDAFKDKSVLSHYYDMEREMKHSCRKPPKPPRHSTFSLSALSAERGRLSRCASDPVVVSLATRKSNHEHKRKAIAQQTSSAAASLCALVFTLCFVFIMLVQGFWSQSSQKIGMVEASNAGSSSLLISEMRNMLVVGSSEETDKLTRSAVRKGNTRDHRDPTAHVSTNIVNIWGRKFK